ncbi:MAG: arginase family protein [Acidobacteriota bacterium]
MGRSVVLIAVPFDLDRRGVEMGEAPGALWSAGLLSRLLASGVSVSREVWMEEDPVQDDAVTRLGRLQSRVAGAVAAAVADGVTPVIIGGDCCNAIGMWSGLTRAHPQSTLNVAWFDAHGDWNTEETTTSGYLGGMPYAAICGYGNAYLRQFAGLIQPAPTSRCILVGSRDLDAPEAELLRATSVRIVHPDELHGAGSAPFQGQPPPVELYLHFDIDVLDPAEAPGVTYPSPGGVSSADAVGYCRWLIASTPLAGLTLAAVNPSKDPSGRTVETAMRLLEGILGEAAAC